MCSYLSCPFPPADIWLGDDHPSLSIEPLATAQDLEHTALHWHYCCRTTCALRSDFVTRTTRSVLCFTLLVHSGMETSVLWLAGWRCWHASHCGLHSLHSTPAEQGLTRVSGAHCGVANGLLHRDCGHLKRKSTFYNQCNKADPLQALLAPFFYSITFGDENGSADYPMELSTVASIVANLSGLMTGGLYLFLRGGRKLTNPFNIRNSLEDRQYNQQDEKQAIKDLAGPDQRHRDSSPSVYSHEDGSRWQTNAAHESTSTYPYGAGNLIDANNPSFYPTIANQQTEDFGAQNKARHSERSSYSFFSQGSGSGVPSTTLLPSTTYTRESGKMSPASKMLMPPPLFTSSNVGMHQRNSSVGSSATVQIGLRISNMIDMQGRRPSKPHSPRHTPLRSPAAALTPNHSCTAAPRSPLAAPAIPSGHSRNESNGSDLNKDLPRTPPESPAQVKQKEPCQLSPTVYEPQRQPPKARLASPKGVGFHMSPIDRAVNSPVPVTSPTAQGNPGWI